MDSDGDVLIAAKRLELSWSPLDLLDGKISGAKVIVQNAILNLHEKGDRNPFADLAVSVLSGEAPTTEHLGPDLPLALEGVLSIDGFDLNQVTDGKLERLVTGAELDGSFKWRGPRADLAVSSASGTRISA